MPSVSESDHQRFVQQTDGCSGDDIHSLMKTARGLPLRFMMQATHFRQTKDHMWHACAPEDPDAVARKWDEVPAGRLWKAEISLEDVNQAMTRVVKSVSQHELGRFESWTRDFGQDG